VGDREVEVAIDGERVTVAGRTVVVHRTGIAGTPLHQVMIDGRPLLLPLERLGPGRWSVTAWGERRDAAVLDERAKQIEGLVREVFPLIGSRKGAGDWARKLARRAPARHEVHGHPRPRTARDHGYRPSAAHEQRQGVNE